MPTLFTGHMSGVNWIPAWASAPGDAAQRFRVVSSNVVSQRVPRSWFEDAEVTAAQRLLAYESANALAGHAAVSAWDLGNENSNCVQPADSAAGVQWLESMAEGIRQADAHAIVTVGLHMEDLEHDRKIGPAEAATVCDFLTMHGYPIYAPWSQGPTDEHLLGFLTEVTRWLGVEPVSCSPSSGSRPWRVMGRLGKRQGRYLSRKPRPPTTPIGPSMNCAGPAPPVRCCGARTTMTPPSGVTRPSTKRSTNGHSAFGEATGRPNLRWVR